MSYISPSLLPLAIALLVLLIDSAIEMAFISSMVGYLHRSGANQYQFYTLEPLGNVNVINAKPKCLMGDEGHVSNGAAGTNVVLLCFGGTFILWRQMNRNRAAKSTGLSKLFLTYTLFTILAFLLTLTALIYTFVLISQTSNQAINTTIASQFQGEAYPLDKWTPQTWTRALLALPLVNQVDADYLGHWLKIMEGWRWNLIPMMVANLVVAGLAVRECVRQRGAREGERREQKEGLDMRG